MRRQLLSGVFLNLQRQHHDTKLQHLCCCSKFSGAGHHHHHVSITTPNASQVLLGHRQRTSHQQRRAASAGGTASLLLSPAETSKILRQNEATIDLESKSPVKYYEINHLGANQPPEDRQAQAKTLTSEIYLFGVFDGHGGYYCSDTISQRLFDYVALNFLTAKQLEDKAKWSANQSNNNNNSDSSSASSSAPDASAQAPPNDYPLWFAFQSPYGDFRTGQIKELHRNSLQLYSEELLKERIIEESMGDGSAIELDFPKILKKAFVKLDHDISIEAMPNAASGKAVDKDTMNIAMSGSCACVALLTGKNLYVANCGDARALLGIENDDGTYSPLAMSNDHNSENQQEVQRLFAEHPKIEQGSLIRHNRLLEMLLPFRAFGDNRLKWTQKDLKDFAVPIYGHGIVPLNYHTPPYLTALPEVLHRRLTYKDKFLVLATDGLWELLSPERVVQLIGNHMRGQQSFDPYQLPEDKSLKLREVFEDLTKRRVSLSHQPVDHNSATHLIRQALGNDHIQLSKFLRADAPRNLRDDITITVIYFDTDYIIETYK